jgi:copper chaperone
VLTFQHWKTPSRRNGTLADSNERTKMLELTLPGMTCGGCARGVTAAIKSVDPAAEVMTDVPGRTVRIESSAKAEAIKAAVAEAGYTAA